MRILLKCDKKITAEELDELQRQFIDLYYTHTKLVPEFFVEETDFSYYQTYIDSDGDVRPTGKYLKDISNEVHKRYGDFGTDHIVLLVHEDNWKSDTDYVKGIWGTAYANLHHSYYIQYCRFDRDNIANSLGVLHHEIMHTHDSLIRTTLGVDIEPILKVDDYDSEIVHGKGKDWSYIRYTENTKALQIMQPYLYQAYEKRRALHNKHLGMMKTVINLASTLVVLLRAKLNQKNGIPR